jgi:hypothetical protein
MKVQLRYKRPRTILLNNGGILGVGKRAGCSVAQASYVVWISAKVRLLNPTFNKFFVSALCPTQYDYNILGAFVTPGKIFISIESPGYFKREHRLQTDM